MIEKIDVFQFLVSNLFFRPIRQLFFENLNLMFLKTAKIPVYVKYCAVCQIKH